MSISNVLTVIPVSDFDAAHAWYERLFGAPASNLPMPGQLVEWQLTDGGWAQITRDPEHAGSTFANFAVDDIERHLAGLRERGLEPGEVVTANKNVQLSALHDADGNTLTFIGNFRPVY